MLAFDTNYLLRYLLNDDEDQSRRVSRVIEEQKTQETPIHLLDLVLMETSWVLQSVYGLDRKELSLVLEDLLHDPIFSFDDSSRLWKALEMYQNGKADFDDYLILAQSASLGLQLQTFDEKLQREI
jgi:predicted nucleic-acid-binding protein